MESIWMNLSKKTFGKTLKQDICRDVVVVGGGIAGTLCAYTLCQSGKKVTLIEGETLFSGVTQFTTAHITANQGYVYLSLPKEGAKLYFKSQKLAIEEFENLILKNKIDCDFKRLDDYLFTIKNPKKLFKLFNLLKSFGANVTYTSNKDLLKIKTKGYIKLCNQAMFNPIKFLKGLDLSGIEIFENSRVLKIDINNKTLVTKNAKITANKIVIATNYPIVNIRGLYITKLYKSQSYALATKCSKNINGLFQSDLENGLTFRPYQNSLIVGGLDHRTGRVNHFDKFERLKAISKKYFSADKPLNFWSANDCITYDGVPLVGRFNKNNKDIFVITGFNKWGMANSMASALIIKDLIEDKQNEFEKVFAPLRFNFNLGGLLVNIGVSLKNILLKPLLPPSKSFKSLKNGEGNIAYCEGKKAVFKDKEGKLFINSPFCKHMGCQLKFNPNTNSWDCPCHGSRYDINGKIITAPTVYDLDNFSGDKKEKTE